MIGRLLAPAGISIEHVGQEASRANKLFTPCRNEKKGTRGRSHPEPTSFSHPAGMKKRHEGQEASRSNKLFTPCRNEYRACGAGGIPVQQALHTLPE